MSNIENRVQILEQKAANSKPVNLLDLLSSIVGTEFLPVYSPQAGKLVKLSIQEIINNTGLSELSFNEIAYGQVITFDGVDFTYSPLVSFPNVVVNAGQLVFLTLNILDETDETLSKRLYLVEKPSGSYDFNTLINSGDILEIKREAADPNQSNTVTYTVTDLTEINTASPAFDFTDTNLIYFIEIDGVLYRFIGTNGLYGSGELQMDFDDLIQVGSSESNITIDLLFNFLSNNAIANSAVTKEFIRTNYDGIGLINTSISGSTQSLLDINYRFLHFTGTSNQSILLTSNAPSDFNVEGYANGIDVVINADAGVTLIAPYGQTVTQGNFFRIRTKKGVYFLEISSSGDMTKIVYDPQNISADAFARDNHTGNMPATNASLNNSNHQVTDDTNVQSYTDSLDAFLRRSIGTEVFSLGDCEINPVDDTKVDIGAVVGQINDFTNLVKIDEGEVKGFPVSNIAATQTFFYYDNLGNLQQQNTTPTLQEWREKLFFVRFVSDGVKLIARQYLFNPSGQYSNGIRDLYKYLHLAGVPLFQDLNVTPNADLTFNISSGVLYKFGRSNNLLDPSEIELSENLNAQFFLFTRDTIVNQAATQVPVDQYDLNGTLTTIPNNKPFVIHKLRKSTENNNVLQYAQNTYATLDEAILNVNTQEYVDNPDVAGLDLIGYWIVRKNTTSLNDPADARFKKYSIGGSSNASAAGVLLAANDLSDVNSITQAIANLTLKKPEVATPPTTGTITVNLSNYMGIDYTGTSTALEVYDVDTVNAVQDGNAKYLYDGLVHPTVTGATWLKSFSSYEDVNEHIASQEYYLVFEKKADGIYFWLIEKKV